MSKKHILAECLDKTHLLDVFAHLGGRLHWSGRLTTLAYHRVFEFDPKTYLFDEDIISASPEQFDQQMAYVKGNFDPLSFEDLKGCVAARKFPPKPLLITFDDGYRDNYDFAYPILKRHGLSAIIFLTADYIGRQEPFWFEQIAYWIKTTKKRTFILKADRQHTYRIEKNRRPVIHAVQALLKSVDDNLQKDLMEQLGNQLDGQRSFSDLAQPLCWECVREMSQNGIEFGSHSMGHFNMANLSDARLRKEIFDSKAVIEGCLRKPIFVFSYPIGGRQCFDDRVRAMLSEAGYEFAVSYIDGVDRCDSFDHYGMRRIHVERADGFTLFKATLLLPHLFCEGSQP